MLWKFWNRARQIEPPKPLTDVQIVGDIHGRDDLLETLLERLDLTRKTVFLGDYIDRGDNSKRVLESLKALTESHKDTVVCLLGNHEEMLLRTLDGQPGAAQGWLRHGGLQTLASFGVQPPKTAGPDADPDFIQRLSDALGDELIAWIRGLPLTYQSGSLVLVHAAVDPDQPLHAQSREVMLWGHPSFERKQRTDGMWIAHGHTIKDQAQAMNGRIALDTGAYATGRLSAARISTDGAIDFFHS